MNKVNFDSLKNIKAPEEWIAKAASIPDTAVQKRAFPAVSRTVTAASIVLVGVIGLVVFLMFGGGKAPVAVRGRSMTASELSADETVADHAENTGTMSPAETIAVLSTDAEGRTVIAYAEQPSPTVTAVRPTESVLNPTSPSTALPTLRQTEKAAPTSAFERPPAERPSAATAPPAPSAAPPTELPAPTQPPATAAPTELWPRPEGTVSFFATFDSSLIGEGETIYCVYAREGYAAAASAKQKAEYYITKNGTVCAYCEASIPDLGESICEENTVAVVYRFINERGETLASGTQAV